MRTLLLSLISFAAIGQTVSIAPAVFTGSGLNDATAGGRFNTAPANNSYVVTISATGTPDHFTWTKNGGAASSPVAITGSAQALADGVTIAFAATTGHHVGDSWTINTTASGSVALSSFAPLGNGALVSRSAQDKMRESVSILDFGTPLDCVSYANDRFRNAVAGAIAQGKRLYVPAGTCALFNTSYVGRISSASWSSSVATFVLDRAHGLTTGQQIASIYDAGAYSISSPATVTVISSTSFSIPMASNPGGSIPGLAPAGQGVVTTASHPGKYILSGISGARMYGDGPQTVLSFSDNTVVGVDMMLSSNVELRDMTIQFAQSNSTRCPVSSGAINTHEVSNLIISGVTIPNGNCQGLAINFGSGIWVEKSSFTGMLANPIQIANAQNVFFRDILTSGAGDIW